MLNMSLNSGQNGQGVKMRSVSERVDLNEKLDFENAFELIRIDTNESDNTASKVKAILNLLTKEKTLEYILSECFKNDNGGDIIRTGAFNYEDYRITAIHSKANNDETLAILIKNFPLFGYLQNTPNNIKSFSIKRLWISKNKWENQILINIMGNFGREYNVKFNFFAYN